MLLRPIFISIMLILAISACSQGTDEQRSVEMSNTEAESSANKQSKFVPLEKASLDNKSLIELAKNKVPACINSCKQQNENCERGCKNSCKRQCTFDDCNFLEKKKVASCQEKCFSDCDNGAKCQQYCSREQKYCVHACPESTVKIDN